MVATNMGRGSINVGRFRVRYLVPGEHPHPEGIRARMDDIITKNLSDCLSTIMSRRFPDTDSSLWFIRKLELELDMNAGWEPDQIAKRWAMQVVQAISEESQDNRWGQGVIYFEDRAAYLASFLRDLSDGTAWDKWYYGPFMGLKALPVAMAAQTAICGEPAIGLDALFSLTSRDLRKVLLLLTERGTERVMLAMTEGLPQTDETACFGALVEVLEVKGAVSIPATEEWNDALALYIGGCMEKKDLQGPTLKAAALALARLSRLLYTASGARWKEIGEAVVNGNLSAPALDSGVAGAEILSPLVRCPPGLVTRILRALPHGPGYEDIRQPEEGDGRKHTAFGGVFLLLPLLDILPLAGAVDGWPSCRSYAAVDAVRFLALVRCFGRLHAAGAFSDPVLRDIMGIDASLDVSTIKDWQKHITHGNINGCMRVLSAWYGGRYLTASEIPDRAGRHADDRAYLLSPEPFRLTGRLDRVILLAARCVLRDFAGRLPGFASSGFSYLFSNFLDFSASIENEDTRRVVRLGRPPLNIVLNMTGMNRSTYKLRWLDERPLVLFQEG
jgi:hypothetical protein